MPETTCQQCNAPLTGLICEYCGFVANLHMNRDEEMQALTEYHNILLNIGEDSEKEIKLLSKGYIPSSPDVVIEAGVRVIPMIDLINPGDDVAEAASRRLHTIILKLRLLPPTREITQALDEFESLEEEYKTLHEKQIREGDIIILQGVVFLIVACLFVGFLLVLLR